MPDETDAVRVFGLGVGDEVYAVTACLNGRGAVIPGTQLWSMSPLPDNGPYDLQHFLRAFLEQLSIEDERFRSAFDETDAIAISSIGRIDWKSKRITEIKRKPWLDKSRGYLVDFPSVLKGLFPTSAIKNLLINNDATCAALAERDLLPTGQRDLGVFYVTINEGVNIGVTIGHRELSSSFHPEAGHLYPRRHKQDLQSDYKNHQACPAHLTCFEALTSSTRIKADWGCDLSDLDQDHIAWDIVAFYIAQLCHLGYIVFAPRFIVLGGTVLWGRRASMKELEADPKRAEKSNRKGAAAVERNLLPKVRQHFSSLVASYPSLRPETGGPLIRRGSIQEYANLYGALALAKRAAEPKGLRAISGGQTGQ